jgi:tRNA-uridine 2-sulfurtransferase
MRVVCAMSGGVDSSMAAALMLDAGHEVIGMTMRLYDASADERRGRGGTCCSPAEVDAARRVCAQLGFPHYVVDERERFLEGVIDPFARDYAAGRTPNPCTRCNQRIKFDPLLRRAEALGAEVLVTGHYARIEPDERGALTLRRGVDPRKDQSYFLFAMGAGALRRVSFPLGAWNKDDVRRRAEVLGLPNWNAPDSQELCFVPGGDHGAVVQRRLEALGLATDVLAPGPVVDTSGRVVGEHDGIHRVTVGQRRGLRTRGHDKRYVLRVVPEDRTVVVGEADDARFRTLEVGELQSLDLPEAGPFRAEVQIRHRSAPRPATVEIRGGIALVTFDEPVAAVSSGQAAVFYDGDRVLGGGWIERAE